MQKYLYLTKYTLTVDGAEYFDIFYHIKNLPNVQALFQTKSALSDMNRVQVENKLTNSEFVEEMDTSCRKEILA